MSKILIRGINTLVGSYVAARWLQTAENDVVYTDEIAQHCAASLVSSAAEHMKGNQPPMDDGKMRARLKSQSASREFDGPFSSLWLLDDGKLTDSEIERFEGVISSSREPLPAVLNYVVGYDSKAASQGCNTVNSASIESGTGGMTHKRVAQICSRRGLGLRTFCMPLILGAAVPSLRSPDPLDYFLYTLHSFKAEIEERSPQYFDFNALRCISSPDVMLQVLPVSEAADTLMRACFDGPSESEVRVEGYDVPFSLICDRISTTFGLSILLVEEPAALNAVDRAFAERIGYISSYLNSLQPQITAELDYRQIAPQPSGFDEEAQLECFENIRKKLDKIAAARNQRVAELPHNLVAKVVQRDGAELIYYVAGSAGPVIVVLNALGQGLEYWYRLMESLSYSYQVVIWEPRGTICQDPPFGLAEQVDDLKAVLDNEGIESCHVVCWCTSPKVAIDFHLCQPSVFRSMTLLNSTFKCNGSSDDLDTAYEKNLFSLCRMLVQKPTMAASVMKTFQSRTEPDEVETLELEDSEQMSASVLSMMSAGLRTHVLGPFKSEETTLNYAHQMLDFWANDCRSKAADVTIPVLLIGAEYDQVISPLSSEFGAGLFPDAWYVCLSGATHYFLYDRAEILAEILDTFIHNPEKVQGARRKVSLVAQVS